MRILEEKKIITILSVYQIMGEKLKQWTIEMVLNRAVSLEKQSYNLYIWAKDRALYPGVKTLLNELAQEELKHKERIVKVIKDRERIAEIGGEVENLRIIDEMKTTKLSEDATYQEILIYAVKREMETYEYYRDLSERFKDHEVGKLFLRLSEEELKHKNRLEREYDEHVLKEM